MNLSKSKNHVRKKLLRSIMFKTFRTNLFDIFQSTPSSDLPLDAFQRCQKSFHMNKSVLKQKLNSFNYVFNDFVCQKCFSLLS